MINIFVANINVDAQNNFNYMRDDFINKKRNDRENDHDERKNINVNLISRMCYNCDSFEYLFNTCARSHVFDFVLTN